MQMHWYNKYQRTDFDESALQAKQNQGQSFHKVCVRNVSATIIDVAKTHLNYVWLLGKEINVNI